MSNNPFSAFNLRVSNLIGKLNKIDENISFMDIYVKGLIKKKIEDIQLKKYNRVILGEKEDLNENDEIYDEIYNKFLDITKDSVSYDDPALDLLDPYLTYLTDKIGVKMITNMKNKSYNGLLKSYNERLNNESSKKIERELGISNPQSGSGNAKITKKSKKSILGKERCIYKKAGDRKEYLRYKGDLITVKDYTKLMKAKAA